MPCSRKKFPGAHPVEVLERKGKRGTTIWATGPRDALAEAKVLEEIRALGEQYQRIYKNDDLTPEQKAREWKELRYNVDNGTVVLPWPPSRKALKELAKRTTSGHVHDTGSEQDVEMESDTDSESSSESDTDMEGDDADAEEEAETGLESAETQSPPQHFTFSAQNPVPKSPPIKTEKHNNLSLTRTSQQQEKFSRRKAKQVGLSQRFRQRTDVAVYAREAEIAALKAQNKLLWKLVNTVQEQKAMLSGNVEALEWTIVRGDSGGMQRSEQSQILAEKEADLRLKLRI